MPRLSKTNKRNINKSKRNKSKRNKSNIKNKKGGANPSVNNTPKTFKDLAKSRLENEENQIPMTTVEDFEQVRDLLEVFGVDKFSGASNKGISSDKAMGQPIFINSEINPDLPFCFLYGPKGMYEERGYCPLKNGADQNIIPGELRLSYAIMRNAPDRCGEGKTYEEWQTIVQGEGAAAASMSKNHQFIAIMDPAWYLFNLLTLDKGPGGKEEALSILRHMQTIKNCWADERGIPSDMVGSYFHVYPTNSVQSMHMHMVDLRPENINAVALANNEHKNFPLEEAIAYFESQ